jgi:hypothetical protein
MFATSLRLCATADFSQATLYFFERWCGCGRSLIERLTHRGHVLGRGTTAATDDRL